MSDTFIRPGFPFFPGFGIAPTFFPFLVANGFSPFFNPFFGPVFNPFFGPFFGPFGRRFF